MAYLLQYILASFVLVIHPEFIIHNQNMQSETPIFCGIYPLEESTICKHDGTPKGFCTSNSLLSQKWFPNGQVLNQKVLIYHKSTWNAVQDGPWGQMEMLCYFRKIWSKVSDISSLKLTNNLRKFFHLPKSVPNHYSQDSPPEDFFSG